MTYTILSAEFANEDHSAALVETKENGAVAAEAGTPLWDAVLKAKPKAFSVKFDPAAVGAESERRVNAVVPEKAQKFLSALAGGGVLGDDLPAYQAGLKWMMAMQAKRLELIANEDASFREDRHWPVPDPTIVALAKQF